LAPRLLRGLVIPGGTAMLALLGLFVLGLATLGLMALFVRFCDRV
jgi:hypothetical protein